MPTGRPATSARPDEPGDAPTGLPKPAVLLLAIVLGTLGWLAGPDDWPDGAGALEVRVAGEVATVPVTWGDDEPVEAALDVGGRQLALRAPDGLPLEQRLQVLVGHATPGDTDLALGELTVTAELPDGRQEVVPVTRTDAETGSLVATRHPASGARTSLGLLGLVVVLWVTGAIPLFVTSLLVPVVLAIGRVGTGTDVLAPFFHPIIALFFAGFLMAEAMRRVGLDQRIARTLVGRAGRGPRSLFATMMLTSAFLSMWMSNTAAVALLIPIALAVTAPLEHAGYQRATVLAIAYAATAGGVGSAIGTPANLLAIELLETFADRRLTFLGWFAYGLPVLATLLPIIGWHVWRRFSATVDPARFEAARRAAREAAAAAPKLDRAQLEVIGVLVLVATAWLTAGVHDVDPGIVALTGAVALTLLGHVRQEDLGRISWASLLTFGGGLTLGVFLTRTGVADWVAGNLGSVSGLGRIGTIAVVAAVALGTTTVASNTATAAMLVPLAIPLAAVLGVDATTLVIVVAVASSVDFALVIGTPPTMLAYSTELFRPSEILRTGLPLDLAGLAATIAAAVLLW